MIDISTGIFSIDILKGWQISPMLSKKEFLRSPLYESCCKGKDYQATDRHNIYVGPLTIGAFVVNMEVHIGDNDFIDEVTLRMPQDRETEMWNNKIEWEKLAYETKQKQEEFLRQETGLSSDLFNGKKEFYLGANWGSISTTYCLSFEPDIHISIRYRNMTEEEKKKYLSLGKKYLNAKK